ncbi:hypothetical protein MMC11_004113 [Xylographa trunciseda]|nr:hypothetical protein [Xylographa trunciseda]
MDPASIVAFIGFGAQCVDSILRLKDFLEEVQDAPEYVQDLRKELDLLKHTVESFNEVDTESIASIPDDVRDLVEVASLRAHRQVLALLKLLNESLPDGKTSRPRNLWNRVKAVLQKEKVSKLVDDLERAKTTLEMAQRIVDRNINARQSRMISNILAQNTLIMQSMSKVTHMEGRNVSRTQDYVWAAKIMSNNSTTKRRSGKTVDILQNDARLDSTSGSLASKTTDVEGCNQWTKPFLKQVIQDVIYEEQSSSISRVPNLTRNISRSSPQFESTSSYESRLEHSHAPGKGMEEKYHTAKAKSTCTDVRYESLDVSYGEATTTVYHSAWLGTITVNRATTAHRTWNKNQKNFEKHHDIKRTSVQVKFAPWISSAGTNLKFDEMISMCGITQPVYALESVRYVEIPSATTSIIKRGDLSTLQTMLSQGSISLRDRDTTTYNLLEISLVGLRLDWLLSEISPEPSHDHVADILETCTWLYSQGLRTEQTSNELDPRDCLYLCLQDRQGDIHANVFRMERLLLESTANAPSIPRANRLLLFAILNPQHSKELERAVVDLVEEAIIDEDTTALEEVERQFWAQKPETFIWSSLESIILRSMVDLARLPKASTAEETPRKTRIDILAGIRRVLVSLLALVREEKEQGVPYLANILCLCKPLSVLADGFGPHMFAFAYKEDVLDSWCEILRRADYRSEDFVGSGIYSHLQSMGQGTTSPAGWQRRETEFWHGFGMQHEQFTSLRGSVRPGEAEPLEPQSRGLLMTLALGAVVILILSSVGIDLAFHMYDHGLHRNMDP